jgi:hypothetical protein
MTSVMSRGYRGISSVARNAKDLILDKRKSLGCAAVLSLFMDERARSSEVAAADDVLDGYLLFDPKVQDGGDAKTREKAKRMLFSDAVLFVVGGGNYIEYEDCMAAIRTPAGSQESRNLVYGTTELLNAEQFLKQLGSLQPE